MTWTKIPDDANETLWNLSADALRLHLFGLIYCNRMLTDGLVTASRLATLTPNYQPAHLDELVATGLWVAADGGYQIAHFLEEQIPRAKVLEKRAETRQRVADWRSRNAVGNAVTSSKTPGKTLTRNAVTPGTGVNYVNVEIPVPGVTALQPESNFQPPEHIPRPAFLSAEDEASIPPSSPPSTTRRTRHRTPTALAQQAPTALDQAPTNAPLVAKRNGEDYSLEAAQERARQWNERHPSDPVSIPEGSAP